MRSAVLHLKKVDPTMKRIIENVGPYRISYRPPTFETLVRSIVYQQLSGKAASTIYGRLEAGCKGCIAPHTILRVSSDRARELGLSKQKHKYLVDLAARTETGEVNFNTLADLPDGEVIDHLTQVKGVGVWTAHMFLIFALRRPDVLPTGDLGVRTAIKRAWGLEELPSAGEMETLAGPWRPWCSVASWYLWRSLEGPAEL
jgi:DNA-3-methyladenine glycosylase II